MKKIGQRIGAIALLAGCLAFAACEDEAWNGGQRPVGGETFVVDYAVSCGADTKAIHDNLGKNERISSLTYLLYGSDSLLLQEREIPDISEDTEWPLTRENMTWKQREALKDTLETGVSYVVAFVANVTAGTDGAGWTESPLKEEEDLRKANLELPPGGAFADGTMFYLFTKKLSTDEYVGQVDRDHPMNFPVRLQRVVTRMDFFGERLPAWMESDDELEKEDKEKSPANRRIHQMSRRLTTALCFGTEGDSAVVASLNIVLTGFANALKEYCESKRGTDMTSTDYSTWNGYVSQCTDLIDSIEDKKYATMILEDKANESKRFLELEQQMYKDCRTNTELKKIWGQTWQGKVATVTYEGTTGGKTLSLAGWLSASGLSRSAPMAVDSTVTISEREFDGFSWIGFGRNEEDTEAKNKITGIEFRGNAGDTNAAFTVDSVNALTTGQGINRKYRALYLPVADLSCAGAYSKATEAEKQGYTEKDYTITIRVQTLLDFFYPDAGTLKPETGGTDPGDGGGSQPEQPGTSDNPGGDMAVAETLSLRVATSEEQKAFIGEIWLALMKTGTEAVESLKKYNYDNTTETIQLTFKIPDFSNTGTLKVVDSWQVESAGY